VTLLPIVIVLMVSHPVLALKNVHFKAAGRGTLALKVVQLDLVSPDYALGTCSFTISLPAVEAFTHTITCKFARNPSLVCIPNKPNQRPDLYLF